MSLFNELKRRNVFRVGLAYLVSAWVIAQVADLVLGNIDAPPWVMQALLLFLGIGFIASIIISWAYELTPEGLKKDADVPANESIVNHTAKKLDYITIIAAFGVLGLFVYQQMNPATQVVNSDSNSVIPAQAGIQTDITDTDSRLRGNDDGIVANSKVTKIAEVDSIAVLPFVNMSSDKDQEYFADGISEEILNALVKATGLRVAGRTSSFSFKGKDNTIKEIGEALQVTNVLEGSVRKQGNNVRITAQLIKADDGFHLWSETYDGSLENIFDLQENISRKVTDELKVILNLNADERLANKMTNNIDAYDLFLRGREAVSKRVNGNLLKGMELLQQAVELDPNFAMAWAVLAEAEAVRSEYVNLTYKASLESSAKAATYANKSIQIDNSSALPHAVLGLLSLDKNEVIKSIGEYRLASRLEPNNSLAIRWLGNSYSYLGLIDKAMPLFERAYALDPLSSVNAYNIAASHFKNNDLKKAIQFFRITGDLRNSIMPQVSFVYSHKGEYQTAKDWMYAFIEESIAQNGNTNLVSNEDIKTVIDGVFGGSKAEKEAAINLGALLTKGTDDMAAFQLEWHLSLENIDRTFEILENKPNLFSGFASDFMWLPSKGIKKFRADPRFIRLMIKHKLPTAWQSIGWPEACQPNEGTDGTDGQFQCQ